MGQTIAELHSGGVVLRTFGAGSRAGFQRPTRAFALSTNERSKTPDYVVLTREEAVKIAVAVFKDEWAERGHPAAMLRDLADQVGIDLDRLLEFDESRER